MSQNPKDNTKVLCYWGPDTPGGEAAAICIYRQDGFYLDGELQISPTWWEYLDEFETPNDAKLRSIIRDLRDELSRRKDGKINRTQHCTECDRLAPNSDSRRTQADRGWQVSKNTYRELSMPEFLRKLADDPNRRFAFADTNSTVWREANILTVSVASDKSPYVTVHDDGCMESFSRVAEIIEIPDPLIPLKKLEALQEPFSEYEWIAMDRNGGAYIYSTVAPTRIGDYWMPSSFNPYHKLQAFNGYATDWKTSLIHIPTEIERIKGLEGGK